MKKLLWLILVAVLFQSCTNSNADEKPKLDPVKGEGGTGVVVVVVIPDPPEGLTNIGTFTNSMSNSITLRVKEYSSGSTTDYTVSAGNSLSFTHALAWDASSTSGSVDMEIDITTPGNGEYNAVSTSNNVTLNGVSTIYSPKKYSPLVTRTWTASSLTGTAPYTYKWYKTNVSYEGTFGDHSLVSTSSSYTQSFDYMPIRDPQEFYLEVEVTDANGVIVSDSKKITRYHSHTVLDDF